VEPFIGFGQRCKGPPFDLDVEALRNLVAVLSNLVVNF